MSKMSEISYVITSGLEEGYSEKTIVDTLVEEYAISETFATVLFQSVAVQYSEYKADFMEEENV